jgi:hypothetical protein
MKHALPPSLLRSFVATCLALALIAATPSIAQNGKWNVTPPQPYTRADFTRDCIAMAPKAEPDRGDWIKRCSKETP